MPKRCDNCVGCRAEPCGSCLVCVGSRDGHLEFKRLVCLKQRCIRILRGNAWNDFVFKPKIPNCFIRNSQFAWRNTEPRAMPVFLVVASVTIVADPTAPTAWCVQTGWFSMASTCRDRFVFAENATKMVVRGAQRRFRQRYPLNWVKWRLNSRTRMMKMT